MAALFSELSNPVSNLGNQMGNGNSLEDKRALELALELTMLNFGDTNGMESLMAAAATQQSHSTLDHSLNAFSALMHGGGNGCGNNNGVVGNIGSIMDETRKKSQNMTECVPVPSSEHVAEIVGRQGKLTKKNYSISIS